MPTPTPPARTGSFRPPPLLIGVGILIVALGFGLPYLIPGTPPLQNTPQPEVIGQPTSPPHPAHGGVSGLGAMLGRLIGCLVAVCGCCVLIARLVGRQPPAPTGTMKVLAALPVDARCSLYLVLARNRRMLVGTDHAGVKALVELPGPVVEIPAEPTAPTSHHDEITVLLTRLRAGATAA